MSPNASGDTTRPRRLPTGILNYQMPANVPGHVASAPIEAGPATEPDTLIGLPKVEENASPDHPVVVTASCTPIRSAASGQATSLSLVDSLMESAPPGPRRPPNPLVGFLRAELLRLLQPFWDSPNIWNCCCRKCVIKTTGMIRPCVPSWT